MSQGGHPPAVVPVPADGGAGGAGVEGAAVRPPRALVHARLLVPFRVIKPKDYYYRVGLVVWQWVGLTYEGKSS